MPQIAPALAAAFGGGALATAVSKVVVGLAFNAISSAITARLNKPDRAFAQQNSRQSGAVVPQAFGVGLYSTVGSDITAPLSHDRRYEGETFQPPPQHTHPDDPQPPLPEPRDNIYTAEETGQGRYLTLLIALSDMPINRVSEILLQGQRFVVGSDLIDVGDPYGMSVAEGRGDEIDQYRDKLWIKIYDGTQTQADPVLMRIYGNHKTRPITSDMTYAGGAYAIVTVENDSELWTNLREIRFVIEGRKIDGAFTQNAMQIAADLAVGVELPNGERFTAGYDAGDIDQDALSAAIAEVNTAGFTCGLEIPVGTPDGAGITALDAMDQILNTCNGTATDVGGRLFFDALSHGLPVVHLTEDDVDISRVQTAELTGSLSNKVNRVSITHPSPDDGWAEKATPVEIDAVAEAEDGQPLAEQVSLPAINNTDNGRMLAQMLIADSRKVRVYALPVRMGLGYLRPKQKVTYTSEADGFANKEFMVETMDVANGETILTIRETDPDDFNPANINISPYQPVVPATVYAPPLLIQVAAVARTIGVEGGAQVAGVSIFVDTVPPSALGWIYEARIVGQINVVTGTVSRHTSLVDVPLNRATDYEVRGIYISETRAVVWSDWVGVATEDVGVGSPSFWDDLDQRASDAAQDAADRANNNFDLAFDRLAEFDLEGRLRQIFDQIELEGVVEDGFVQVLGDIETVEGVVEQNKTELSAQLGDVRADVRQLDTAISDTDYALAQTATTLQAEIGDVAASVVTVSTALATTDAALAQTSSTLRAEIGDVSSEVSTVSTALSTTNSALAQVEDNLEAQIGNLSATVNSNYSALVNADGALATQINNVSTTVGGFSSSISTVQSSIDGISALYGVRINNNGVASGFSLNSDLVNGAPQTDMIFDVDNFHIGRSDNSGDYVPAFSYSFAHGIYMPMARIRDLDVDTVKIKGNAITLPKEASGGYLVGNGAWQQSALVIVDFPSGITGDVVVNFDIEQGYSSDNIGWGYQIRDGGTVVKGRDGMLAQDDGPNRQFTIKNRSGRVFVRLYWKGETSQISHANSRLEVRLIYR